MQYIEQNEKEKPREDFKVLVFPLPFSPLSTINKTHGGHFPVFLSSETLQSTGKK